MATNWVTILFRKLIRSYIQLYWGGNHTFWNILQWKTSLSQLVIFKIWEIVLTWVILVIHPKSPPELFLRCSRTSHVCRQHEFLYPWIHVMGVDAIPYILIFDLSPWSQCCHSGLCQRSGKSGRQTPALRVNSFTWNNNNISLSAIVSAATMIIYIIVFIILFETYGSITSRQY